MDLINYGYLGFVNNCLKERQTANMPPYSYLALLHAESKNKEEALSFLTKLQLITKKYVFRLTKVLGPVPAAMERKAGYFRAHMLMQSKSRNLLGQAIDIMLDHIDKMKPKKTIKWILDVDPIDLSN